MCTAWWMFTEWTQSCVTSTWIKQSNITGTSETSWRPSVTVQSPKRCPLSWLNIRMLIAFWVTESFVAKSFTLNSNRCVVVSFWQMYIYLFNHHHSQDQNNSSIPKHSLILLPQKILAFGLRKSGHNRLYLSLQNYTWMYSSCI